MRCIPKAFLRNRPIAGLGNGSSVDSPGVPWQVPGQVPGRILPHVCPVGSRFGYLPDFPEGFLMGF
jgi:hypothetical protein